MWISRCEGKCGKVEGGGRGMRWKGMVKKCGARPNTFEINGFSLGNGIQKDAKCHDFP